MEKRPIPPWQSGRIRLRLLEARDLRQTLDWRNQDHIRRWFFFRERLAPDQHRDWFARYQRRDDDFVFVIEETGGELRPIGQASLYNIDWVGGTAEYGRLLIGDADAAGRGFAREATHAIVTLAFERLGLTEVHVEVIPSNIRSIRLCEVCGFEVTGRTDKAVRMSQRVVASAGFNQASDRGRKGGLE